jgi:hypothetical protein
MVALLLERHGPVRDGRISGPIGMGQVDPMLGQPSGYRHPALTSRDGQISVAGKRASGPSDEGTRMDGQVAH